MPKETDKNGATVSYLPTRLQAASSAGLTTPPPADQKTPQATTPPAQPKSGEELLALYDRAVSASGALDDLDARQKQDNKGRTTPQTKAEYDANSQQWMDAYREAAGTKAAFNEALEVPGAVAAFKQADAARNAQRDGQETPAATAPQQTTTSSLARPDAATIAAAKAAVNGGVSSKVTAATTRTTAGIQAAPSPNGKGPSTGGKSV